MHLHFLIMNTGRSDLTWLGGVLVYSHLNYRYQAKHGEIHNLVKLGYIPVLVLNVVLQG